MKRLIGLAATAAALVWALGRREKPADPWSGTTDEV